VNSDGIPRITVVAEGQCSSRCYNQQVKAISGSAVIMGLNTLKPLFVDVRNKVCIICITNSSKQHCFYKNWDGASTAIEAEIIRAVSESSIERHGLRYKRLVADGDSSTYLAIKDIYKSDPNYFTSVQKIQCTNHALRRYKMILLALKRQTSFKPVDRQILSNAIPMMKWIRRAII